MAIPVGYNKKSYRTILVRLVMANILRSRFPDKQNALNVFATATFLVYGWTMVSSFWKLPSWILDLRLSEIISVYAYSFLLNFLESCFLTLILIVFGFFLSDNLWKDGFSSASVVWLLISLGSIYLHLHLYEDANLRVDFINSQLRWWVGTFAIAFFVSAVFIRISWLKKLLEMLADRFTVFLYLYIPLTILSFVLILVRIVL